MCLMNFYQCSCYTDTMQFYWGISLLKSSSWDINTFIHFGIQNFTQPFTDYLFMGQRKVLWNHLYQTNFLHTQRRKCPYALKRSVWAHWPDIHKILYFTVRIFCTIYSLKTKELCPSKVLILRDYTFTFSCS